MEKENQWQGTSLMKKWIKGKRYGKNVASIVDYCFLLRAGVCFCGMECRTVDG